MNKTLLEMKGITKRFPGVLALENVRFSLHEGEIHALLGENGAGKSTLIKILTGVHGRDEGSVFFNGAPIHPKTPQDAQKVGISTVYQEVNLCPNLSVAENIYIGRAPKKFGCIDWKTVNKKADALLSSFGIHINVTQTLDSYSVAIQQMVAIIRAVDISAKVLILDEPTSSLTAVEVKKLFDMMRLLKGKGMGIVFVTHFLDQVYAVSDTITVLRGGQYVGTYPAAELTRVDLVAKMIGKEYKELENMPAAKSAAQSGDGKEKLFLSLSGAGSNAISGVDLKVRKGEVMGFSGLLGSGRSEIARMIFGADPLQSGSATVEDKKIPLKQPMDAMRQGIALCPEDRKKEGIIGDLSIRENMIVALQAKRGVLRAISRSQAEALADKYIKMLAIKATDREQPIKNLSGGNQQKVILARWLATEPDLLILDEPTRGIDIGAKAEIQKIVLKLAKDGLATIFISSEIDEMIRCCSRMLILRDKKVVGEISGEMRPEESIMRYIAGDEE
jgi:simple sugar transport system ATP-binding protein